MRICFVIGTLKLGGAEKIVAYLSQELQRRGYDVSIMLTAQSEKSDICADLHQYPVKANTGVGICRTLKRFYKMHTIAKREKFDAIVSFGAVANVDSTLVFPGIKGKLILCERGDPVYVPGQHSKRIRRRLTYWMADGFVFQTKEVQSFFTRAIQQRSFIIPNFIEKRPPCITNNERRQVFVNIARLVDLHKGQTTLIEAFSIFAKTNKTYSLEIYGEGPDRALLTNRIRELGIQDRAFLMGHDEGIDRILSDTGIFVLSSNHEGMPNALIEAMARGLPCISTNCGGGGAAALIKNGKNGLLVPCSDPEALANAMIELVSNDDLRNRLGKSAYCINDTLDFNTVIDSWEAAINKICHK